jgi:hypothetical protein
VIAHEGPPALAGIGLSATQSDSLTTGPNSEGQISAPIFRSRQRELLPIVLPK